MDKEKKTYEEALVAFKADQVDISTKFLVQDGGVQPMISVLCYDKKLDDYGTVMAPIFGDFDVNDRDIIIDHVIPEVFAKIKEEDLIPKCFSFSSEAWLRTGKKGDTDPTSESIKSLPKEEVLIVMYETLEDSDLQVFIIERNGSAINEKGEVVDNIKLAPHSINDSKNKSALGGRFVGILKKYV